MIASFRNDLADFMSNPDPRVATWPMMESPLKTIALAVAYLLFIKFLGPRWMKHRQPYDLRFAMIIYNFYQVGVSAWVFMNLGIYGWFAKYSWRCEPMDYSLSREAIKVAEACWFSYISKFVDFLDTVFFVLRKKDSQITTLHVFHHFIVPMYGWIGTKYAAGGNNTFIVFINSFVHIWMYLYYGLSACGPSFRKYLWWKKYLTILQMIQFVVVLVSVTLLYITPKCQVSKFIPVLSILNAIVFLVFFLNFYVSNYKKKKDV